MAKETIYLVWTNDKESGEKTSERLIEATTGHKAERHVISEKVSSRPAKPREVAELMGKGVTLEKV